MLHPNNFLLLRNITTQEWRYNSVCFYSSVHSTVLKEKCMIQSLSFFNIYIYIFFLIGDVIMNFLNLFWSICYEGSLATTAASANAGGFLVCRISVQMWQQHDVIGCNCCEGVIKCQCANNLQIKEPSAPFPTSLFSRKC